MPPSGSCQRVDEPEELPAGLDVTAVLDDVLADGSPQIVKDLIGRPVLLGSHASMTGERQRLSEKLGAGVWVVPSFLDLSHDLQDLEQDFVHLGARQLDGQTLQLGQGGLDLPGAAVVSSLELV